MKYTIITQAACVAILATINAVAGGALPWWVILSPLWLPLVILAGAMLCALFLLLVVVIIAAIIGAEEDEE